MINKPQFSVRTELLLDARFNITPDTLTEVQMEVPLSLTDYVPLRIFDIAFPTVWPTITSLGGGAVAISLGRPFGFMRRTDGEGRIIASQKTSSIVVAASEYEDRWMATLETNNPLDTNDEGLFSQGIGFYAAKAHATLHRPKVSSRLE